MSFNAHQDQWQNTACILCSLNCGLEVQTGGEDGRQISRLRGDKQHPISRGYLCEKPQRLNHYQNAADRLKTPLRRTPDGDFEAIGWDTAIREIADRFKDLQARHGGESIFFYGGGGQGNHLGGAYAGNVLQAMGSKYRSNALAQEKTGEFWVNGKMFGCGIHGDFEHSEVSVFIGKNPWQSHGFARARMVLKQIEKDPKRSMIVIDPRRSETARMADYHLAIKPGTDAWCLAALVAIIVQENLVAHDWLAAHTTGFEEVAPHFSSIPIPEFAAACGVEEALLRKAAHRIAEAESVSFFEDLGMQMAPHSTLGSYLQRLIWLLTGHFARKGTNNAPTSLIGLNTVSKGTMMGAESKRKENLSPVVGAKIIIGLIPCNVIPEEILTDHPKRYRAMLIESANPVHSLAESQKMREALRALELVVVIDVAMTETAREADYILPAASQFEKCEATFFGMEVPENVFQLRRPLFEPLAGTLPEAEIYSRLVEAMGELADDDLADLKAAAASGRAPYGVAFHKAMKENPKIRKYAGVALYRTLGPTLPPQMKEAALLWAGAHRFVQGNPRAAAKAGFDGPAPLAGEKLFQAILDNPSGVVFSSSDYEESWQRVGLPDNKVNLVLDKMLAELPKLAEPPPIRKQGFPFILSAGERRSETANTIVRSPGWRKPGPSGGLRISPRDAEQLGFETGDSVLLATQKAEVKVVIEVSAMMQPGHISLPNGLGLDYRDTDGNIVREGIAPNELTSATDRDFFAGTPWHKHVPARPRALGFFNMHFA